MNAATLHLVTGNAWRTVSKTAPIFRTTVDVDGTIHTVTAWATPNGKMHIKADDATETTFGLPGMTSATIGAWRAAILAVDPTNAGCSYVTDAARIRDGFRAICVALGIEHPWCAR